MKVLYGQIISEARGKLGGLVASKNTYGNYMRNKVTPANPQTSEQVIARNRLSTISSAWSSLTDEQRQAWNGFASQVSRLNIFGNNVPLTGFNMFQKLNNIVLLCGGSIMQDIPSMDKPDSLTSLSINGIDTDTLSIAFAPTPIPANNKLVVFATPPLSAGVNFVDSEFRLIKVVNPAAVSPLTLSTEYLSKFGTIPSGKRVFVSAYLANSETGFTSLELQASAICP